MTFDAKPSPIPKSSICGSDLHLTGGFVPNMKSGDVLGHETMGEVVEVGKANAKLIALVARHFGVPRAAVSIRSGAASRVKRVDIETA